LQIITKAADIVVVEAIGLTNKLIAYPEEQKEEADAVGCVFTPSVPSPTGDEEQEGDAVIRFIEAHADCPLKAITEVGSVLIMMKAHLYQKTWPIQTHSCQTAHMRIDELLRLFLLRYWPVPMLIQGLRGFQQTIQWWQMELSDAEPSLLSQLGLDGWICCAEILPDRGPDESPDCRIVSEDPADHDERSFDPVYEISPCRFPPGDAPVASEISPGRFPPGDAPAASKISPCRIPQGDLPAASEFSPCRIPQGDRLSDHVVRRVPEEVTPDAVPVEFPRVPDSVSRFPKESFSDQE
jgi:hypothetical protein